MTPDPTRSALRRLLEEATPGPWTLASGKPPHVMGAPYESPGLVIPRHVTPSLGRPMSQANAALIAALRNAAPGLLDEIERLEKERDALRARLEAAASILWMAEKYAEGGGAGGPEMRDYNEVMAVLGKEK